MHDTGLVYSKLNCNARLGCVGTNSSYLSVARYSAVQCSIA
jgi:hypothetical protein